LVETNAPVANDCFGYHFIVKPILADDLQNFEKKIADFFNKGLIPSPLEQLGNMLIPRATFTPFWCLTR